MGIRFFCPKGHKLNVKKELAGKIGICPKCGEHVLIPLQSTRAPGEKRKSHQKSDEISMTQLAENAPEHSQDQKDAAFHTVQNTSPSVYPSNIDSTSVTPSVASTSENSPEPEISDIPEVPAPEEEELSDAKEEQDKASDEQDSKNLLSDPNLFWYVRTLSNQSYGPATGAVIQNWIMEKRIGPNMLVWREGWSSWLEAKNVFPELEQIFAEPAQPKLSQDSLSVQANESNSQKNPWIDIIQATPTRSLRKNHKRKNVTRDFTVISILIIAIIALMGVLVWILYKN